MQVKQPTFCRCVHRVGVAGERLPLPCQRPGQRLHHLSDDPQVRGPQWALHPPALGSPERIHPVPTTCFMPRQRLREHWVRRNQSKLGCGPRERHEPSGCGSRSQVTGRKAQQCSPRRENSLVFPAHLACGGASCTVSPT